MTSIKEKEYDKKINISGTKFSCDDIDDSIPAPLPQKGGFAMIIVGRPGYGKTSLILSLVCKSGKAFNRKFDRVFVWSPSLLQKIFFNRRHLAGAGGSVSIIATSQTYNKIDPKLRKTASHLIQYKPQKKEVENIYDDIINLPKKEFMDVLRYVYDKKHNFLYIDTQLEETKQLHKNFNQLIIRSPNITDFEQEE